MHLRACITAMILAGSSACGDPDPGPSTPSGGAGGSGASGLGGTVGGAGGSGGGGGIAGGGGSAISIISSVLVDPESPHALETAVVEATGDFDDVTTITWATDLGEVTGTGPRVNYTAADGNAVLTVTATRPDGYDEVVVPITVEALRPRVLIDDVTLTSTIDANWSTFSVSGHVAGLAAPSTTKVTFHSHTDVFYDTAQIASVNAVGDFTASVDIHRDVDRITLSLVDSAYDTTVLCNPCQGSVDDYWRFRVPFAADGTNVLASTSHVFDTAIHSDAQIRNLLGRISTIAVGGAASPANLIRSFRDEDQFFLYDQALAVVALSHAGEQAAANRILNALANLQLPSGAWYFSYNVDGSSRFPAAGDRRVSGSIAWVALAINAYHAAFSSTAYQAVVDAALNHLAATRLTVSHGGTSYQPIAFGPTDVPATAWDETTVAALEHNLDAFVAFRDHATLTGSLTSATLATELRAFAEAMYDGERFYPGIDDAGILNTSEIYLDPQSWGVLVLSPNGENDYAAGLSFNCREFVEPAGYINYDSAGVLGFFDLYFPSMPKRPFVWSEGTLGMVLALQTAGIDDCAGHSAADYLDAMHALTDTSGGVPYATYTSNVDFSTSSSVAGTAWLYFAEHGLNPFAPL